MREQVLQFMPVVVAAGAGGCAFLYCANRILMLYRDSLPKTAALMALGLLFTVGPGLAVLRMPRPARTGTALSLAGLVTAAEVRHQIIRRRIRGSRPLNSDPHAFRLQRPVTTMELVTHRYRVHLPKWRGPALRIVHVSDLHVTSALPVDYYRRVLEEAARHQADLGLITGDFVTHHEGLPTLAQLLKPFGRIGTFGILGNHDFWAGADEVREVVTRAGIRLLHDESAVLDFGGQSLVVSGVDHPWHGEPCRLAPAAPDRLHLVLSHAPDNVYRLNKLGADIVFSGHIHAGQFRIPLVGPFISPSLYGRRFDHGHFVVDGTHLFVVSGVGAACPPFRIYCQPDIFLIEIEGANPGTQGGSGT